METTTRPGILDGMSALADGLRGRILLVLDGRELTVGELCDVLQLPQSTVSRHLKTLAEAGWVASRRDGARRIYRMRPQELEPSADRLWHLVRPELVGIPAAEQDGRRLQAVLSRRRSRSREFFAGAADSWDELRDQLFGPRFHLFALLGWLREEWVLGDLGCGTGPLSETVAPHVRQVVAIDGTQAMVAAARRRLVEYPNAEVRQGELEQLPLAPGELDAATLVLVLHHLTEPSRVLKEVARVLRPGGSLLIVDMLPHDRHEYRQEMGHVWMGFAEERISADLGSVGFKDTRIRALPIEPGAKGPALFVATGTLRDT